NDLLAVETAVQLIELLFYLIVIQNVQYIDKLAPTRYYDWVISTPLMLLTTMVYFQYLYNIDTNSKTVRLQQFIKTHKGDIVIVVVCNLLMLMFGYLGEINVLDKYTSTYFGFVFFALAWKKVYDFAKHTQKGVLIFIIQVCIWGLYGIAAMKDNVTKNNMYNILDLFAKNAFGLYLYNEINAKSRSPR
ncbi:hypothetical protein EBZ39_19605, partial [bacterium]|nr:hypothetical protein [bacterium]